MPDPTPPTHPRRRWFRFSLRTLIIVVTVFCVWLGWQMHIVRERQKALKLIKDKGGEYAPALTVAHWMLGGPEPMEKAAERVAISRIRKFLGDTEITVIRLPDNETTEDVERLRQLFPGTMIERLAWYKDVPN